MHVKKILYLIGPTYCGKSSITKELQKNYGYGEILSTTTRNKRSSEDERSMNFVNRSIFNRLSRHNQFIEHVTYANELYGTLKSSVLDAFEDSVIAIKVIEMNGLIQILKSGFHESSDIDFVIVYVKPLFEGYNELLKLRSNWEQRKAEDKDLYDLFKNYVNVLALNNKHLVVTNKSTIQEVCSEINSFCMFSDIKHTVVHSIIGFPEFVVLDKKSNNHMYSVTVIDSICNTVRSSYYIHSDKYFNAIRFAEDAFGDDIHYKDDEYIMIRLSHYGMFVIISKNGSD